MCIRDRCNTGSNCVFIILVTYEYKHLKRGNNKTFTEYTPNEASGNFLYKNFLFCYTVVSITSGTLVFVPIDFVLNVSVLLGLLISDSDEDDDRFILILLGAFLLSIVLLSSSLSFSFPLPSTFFFLLPGDLKWFPVFVISFFSIATLFLFRMGENFLKILVGLTRLRLRKGVFW